MIIIIMTFNDCISKKKTVSPIPGIIISGTLVYISRRMQLMQQTRVVAIIVHNKDIPA